MNAIKNCVILALTATVIILASMLNSARYELKQTRKTNADWSNIGDFQNSNHIAVTKKMQATIDALQKANSGLTNN
jgi:hypothetical protein